MIDVNSHVMHISSEFMVNKSPDNNMDKNTLIPAQNSEDYTAWLVDLKARIRSAQTKAAVAVNKELILLYWQIGREILDRQEHQGWGAKVIGQLADDLRREFPEMKGLSRSNLMYMRSFAATWSDYQFVQAVLGQLPWYHQIALLDKIKTQNEREWYAKAAIEHGWSRNVLVHQIETELHKRQGAALTNFNKTLPAAQADIAQQLIKDPCILNFMTLDADAKEHDLENALVDHLEVDKAVLLGNSLGGVNTYQFAARHPNRVKALVIEDIGAAPDADASFVLAWEGTFPSREALEEHIGQRLAPYLLDSFRSTQNGWRLAFEPREMLESQLHLKGDHWADWLATECPALLIRGRQSRITTQDHLKQMAARRPNTRLVALDGGHVVHQDNPNSFTDTVREFLHGL
ncbi:MAG: alpha/beta fold hydrolase [Acidiferrobacteraceae bacterium]